MATSATDGYKVFKHPLQPEDALRLTPEELGYITLSLYARAKRFRVRAEEVRRRDDLSLQARDQRYAQNMDLHDKYLSLFNRITGWERS